MAGPVTTTVSPEVGQLVITGKVPTIENSTGTVYYVVVRPIIDVIEVEGGIVNEINQTGLIQ